MKKHDVIVVGAGPAGAAAAYSLAKDKLDVVLFERGEFAGEKNMFGGVIYGSALNDLIPNYWDEAPLERRITRKVITFLTEEDALSIELDSNSIGEPPYSGFSVRRNVFDRWFAQKAKDAGALLINRTVVDDLIRKDGKVVGVSARRDQGDMYADVVVAADGVNSFIAKKAGLRKEHQPIDINLGVKETIYLPQNVIEERFRLSGKEGVANEFVGGLKGGVHGGGFLYTNKDSLSIGIVAQFPSLMQEGVKIYEVLNEFKNHPLIRRMIKDGVVKEYSAHLIPEGGFSMIPQLYTDGMVVVGDAAGFSLNTGWALEGANYAISSGMAAAEAIKEAAQKGDFSKESLARYEELLKENNVLKDMKTFRNAPKFMLNPRLHKDYPYVLCGLAKSLFTVTGQAKPKLLPLAMRQLKDRVGTVQAIKDGFEAGRALLW